MTNEADLLSSVPLPQRPAANPHAVVYTYSRWDGAQEAPPAAEAVLAALADDLLADGDLARGLTRLARRGLPGPEGLPGLDHLLEEARRRLAALAPSGESDADGRDEAEVLGERRAALTGLVAALAAARAAGDPGQVDGAAVAAWLGDTAAGALGHLQRLALTLMEGGYVQVVGDRQTLTPRAVRLIGQQALRDLFAHVEYHRSGPHDRRRHGHGGEPTGVSAPYVFGAPCCWTWRQRSARRWRVRAAARPSAWPPLTSRSTRPSNGLRRLPSSCWM